MSRIIPPPKPALLNVLRAISEALPHLQFKPISLLSYHLSIEPVASSGVKFHAKETQRSTFLQALPQRVVGQRARLHHQASRVGRPGKTRSTDQRRRPGTAPFIDGPDKQYGQLLKELPVLVGHEVPNHSPAQLLGHLSHTGSLLRVLLSSMEG